MLQSRSMACKGLAAGSAALLLTRPCRSARSGTRGTISRRCSGKRPTALPGSSPTCSFADLRRLARREVTFAETDMADYLPRKHLSRYNLSFAEHFLVCVLTVV